MKKNYMLKNVKVDRSVDILLPLTLTLEEMIDIVGGSYGDLFVTTRQKIAAFHLWNKFKKTESGFGNIDEAEYLDNLIYFLYNTRVTPAFIRFCAKSEGEKDAKNYFLSQKAARGRCRIFSSA